MRGGARWREPGTNGPATTRMKSRSVGLLAQDGCCPLGDVRFGIRRKLGGCSSPNCGWLALGLLGEAAQALDEGVGPFPRDVVAGAVRRPELATNPMRRPLLAPASTSKWPADHANSARWRDNKQRRGRAAWGCGRGVGWPKLAGRGLSELTTNTGGSPRTTSAECCAGQRYFKLTIESQALTEAHVFSALPVIATATAWISSAD